MNERENNYSLELLKGSNKIEWEYCWLSTQQSGQRFFCVCACRGRVRTGPCICALLVSVSVRIFHPWTDRPQTCHPHAYDRPRGRRHNCSPRAQRSPRDSDCRHCCTVHVALADVAATDVAFIDEAIINVVLGDMDEGAVQRASRSSTSNLLLQSPSMLPSNSKCYTQSTRFLQSAICIGDIAYVAYAHM